MERLRQEEGFGLVELLVALTILAVALMALVAGLDAGAKALQRSSTSSNAAAAADVQMESFRALPYGAIWCAHENPATVPSNTPAAAANCADTFTVTGGDGRLYSVRIEVGYTCPAPSWTLGGDVGDDPSGGTTSGPTCSGSPPARPLKLVTIVVRAGGEVVHRQSSTFDRATG